MQDVGYRSQALHTVRPSSSANRGGLRARVGTDGMCRGIPSVPTVRVNCSAICCRLSHTDVAFIRSRLCRADGVHAAGGTA